LILEAIGGHARDRISLLSFLLVGVSVAGVALVSVSDAHTEEAGEVPEKKAAGDLIAVLRYSAQLLPYLR
jgi:hypothetical protein